jgi:hypothetical protein
MTVGHALLLLRLQSPFAPGERPPALIGDCALTIEVCRRSHQSAVKFVDSWRCRPWLWWRWLRLSFCLERSRGQLLRYVSAAWTGPDVWVEKHANGNSGDGDAMRTIINTLTAKLGRSYSDTLAMPLRQALWDVCEYWRQEGALRFATDAEKELLAEMRRQGNG